MASNGRGGLRPAGSTRSPPFIVIGLLVVIAILAFNYWNMSSRNNFLNSERQTLTEKYKMATLQKITTDKKNEKMLSQVQLCNTMEIDCKKQKDLRDEEIKKLNNNVKALQQRKEGEEYELAECNKKQKSLTETLNSEIQKLNSELSDCKAKKEQLESAKKVEAAQKPPSCVDAEHAAQLVVLKKVQAIWGNSAVVQLRQQGINIDGIDLQNLPQGESQIQAAAPKRNRGDKRTPKQSQTDQGQGASQQPRGPEESGKTANEPVAKAEPQKLHQSQQHQAPVTGNKKESRNDAVGPSSQPLVPLGGANNQALNQKPNEDNRGVADQHPPNAPGLGPERPANQNNPPMGSQAIRPNDDKAMQGVTTTNLKTVQDVTTASMLNAKITKSSSFTTGKPLLKSSFHSDQQAKLSRKVTPGPRTNNVRSQGDGNKVVGVASGAKRPSISQIGPQPPETRFKPPATAVETLNKAGNEQLTVKEKEPQEGFEEHGDSINNNKRQNSLPLLPNHNNEEENHRGEDNVPQPPFASNLWDQQQPMNGSRQALSPPRMPPGGGGGNKHGGQDGGVGPPAGLNQQPRAPSGAVGGMETMAKAAPQAPGTLSMSDKYVISLGSDQKDQLRRREDRKKQSAPNAAGNAMGGNPPMEVKKEEEQLDAMRQNMMPQN